MKPVKANGIQFHCKVSGKEGAPWVVFSNCLATNLSLWDEQAALLEERFRILRYDQRGHGKTDVTPSPYNFEQLTDDAVELLDAFEIGQCIFVGSSMGAVTGLRLASRHPGRVLRVMACDGQWASPPGSDELWQERARIAVEQGMDALVEPTVQRWFQPHFVAENPPRLNKIREMIRTTPTPGYIACSRALHQYDYIQDFSRMTVPSLLLVGQKDGVLPTAMREMHQAIPGSRFEEIEDAGHLPNIEKPREFNQALLSFLEE